jgi:hypothetical protein
MTGPTSYYRDGHQRGHVFAIARIWAYERVAAVRLGQRPNQLITGAYGEGI